jgi:hypothetical protein
VAQLIGFLACDASSHITGTEIYIEEDNLCSKAKSMTITSSIDIFFDQLREAEAALADEILVAQRDFIGRLARVSAADFKVEWKGIR